MTYRLFPILLLILVLGTACKRAEVEPNQDPGAASDQAKFQAMWEKTLRGTPLSDLPEKYQTRTIPDREKGEIFQIFSDGKLLRTVHASEFGCEEELHHLKKRKVRDSCAFLPFLERILGKRIESLELAGEGRDYVYARFGSAHLHNEKSELAAFINKQGEFRVEERPVESFISDEKAAKGGDALQEEKRLRRQEASLAEARQREQNRKEGKRSEKRRKRGQGVRNAFKTRSLYWVDVYETDAFPEQSGGSDGAGTGGGGGGGGGKGAATGGGRQRQEQTSSNNTVPADGTALRLLTPGGESRTITPADLAACKETGCEIARFLPRRFDGTWCVTHSGGEERIAAEKMKSYRIKERRQGGLVLFLGEGIPGAIRSPTLIAPCKDGGGTGTGK